MCGISGIIHLDQQQPQQQQICTMIRAMKHRGPNDEGVFIENRVGLGFVRLSIIDLSPAGHQPMFSADDRYVIIFNGEIFNYIELKEELQQQGVLFRTQTDTEVLLNGYQVWGEQMLHKLNGMWAFVIYDRHRKTLFAARDRYGVKPFYYYLDEERFIFASEIPPILQVLGKKPTPNLAAVFDFLVFNRTDQKGETFYNEIQKLNHGHTLTLQLHQPRPNLVIKQWYNLKKELKTPFDNPEEFRALFSSAVGLRLRSDVPVGVCLSGGLDSSSIVSTLLKDYNKSDLHTFSVVYGPGKHGDESKFIHLYRPLLPNMHFTQLNEHSLLADIETFIRAHAEPVPTTSPYAQYKVMQLAKENVTVTLDGQGADEALAGYHYFFGFYFKNLLLQGRIGRLADEIRHYTTKHQSLFGIKSFLFFLLPTALRTRLRAMEKGYLNNDFYQYYAAANSTIAGELYGSTSLREALLNHFEYKLEHLLKWEDRNSMWFSLEARVPFLDYRLVERTLSLAGDQVIKQGMTKHILREAMRGTLPEAIRVRRDKMGFGTPQDEWFRAPVFQQYIRDLIYSDTFANRGIIDASRAQSLYKKHVAGQGNYAKEIWKWIHLENWYRQFID